MLIDPQLYNLFSYVRNNPLRFIDPKGEEIELIGDEEQRKKALDALRQGVGEQAGAYLYEKKVTDNDGNTRYLVGIHKNGLDGKGPDFKSLNVVANVVGRIIEDKAVATVTLVQSGTVVEGFAGDKAIIGPLPGRTAAASTSKDFAAKIWLLDPSTDYGYLPGSVMSDGRANRIDAATAFIHELGHVAFHWEILIGPSKDAAVLLESHSRKLRDPSGPTRIKHEPNDRYEAGKGPFQIKITRSGAIEK